MDNTQKKTPAEHKAYIRSLTRISFFFAYQWHAKHPDETMGAVVRNRTPLFHHALGLLRNEGEEHGEWQRLQEKVRTVAEKAKDAAEFEEIMFAFVTPFAYSRADRFYPQSVGVALPKDWNVRSLKYDPPKDSLPATYCTFHIANALAPRSIFDDPEHLPLCFLELMDRSEAEFGYDMLYTSTWLNDHPKWLPLFPREWHDNLSPRSGDVSWTFGHWYDGMWQ